MSRCHFIFFGVFFVVVQCLCAQETAESYVLRADAAYQEGNLKKAIEIYEMIGKRFPTYEGGLSVRFNLAIAYYQADRYPDAIKTLKEIVAKVTNDPGIREQSSLLLAGALAGEAGTKVKPEDGPETKAKLFKESLDAYDAHLKNYPNTKAMGDVLYGKAFVQFQAEDFAGAENTLTEFRRQAGNSSLAAEAAYLAAKVLASQARKLMDDKKNASAKDEASQRLDNAEKLFLEVSKNEKSMAMANDAYRSAGEIFARVDQHERALKYLRLVKPTGQLVDAQEKFVEQLRNDYQRAVAGNNPAKTEELKKLSEREKKRLNALKEKVSSYLGAQVYMMQCYLNLKRNDEVLALGRHFLPFFDTDQKKVARFFMMMAMINNKDVDGAIADFEDYKKNFPKDKMVESVGPALAQYFKDAKKPLDAVKWSEDYLAVFPKGQYDEAMMFMRSSAYLEAGEIDKAKKANDEFLSKYPKSPMVGFALFQKGYAAYQKGDYAAAISDFREYIAKFGNSDNAPTAGILIVNSFNELKKYDDVIKEVPAFRKKFPGSDLVPRALFLQAKAYEARRNTKETIGVYDEIVKSYPQTEVAPIAQYYKIILFFQQRKTADAMTALDDFIKLFPKDKMLPDIYLTKADELKNSGKLDDAVKAFQDIVARFKDHEKSAEAVVSIGAIEMGRAQRMAANPQKLTPEKQAEWKAFAGKARAANEEVLKKYARYPAVDKALSSLSNYWQANIHATFGTKEDAVAYFKKLAAEAEAPDTKIKISFTLGSLLSLLGDRETALKALGDAYQQAKAADVSLPNSGYAQYRSALIDAKKFDETIEMSQRQLDEKQKAGDNNGKAEAVLGLARGYFEKGDYAKAGEYLRQISSEYAWNKEVSIEGQILSAFAEEKKKKYDEAIKLYSVIIKAVPLSQTEARLKIWMRTGYSFHARAAANPAGRLSDEAEALTYFLKIGLTFKAFPKYAAEGLYRAAEICECGIVIKDPKAKTLWDRNDAIGFYQTIVKDYPGTEWAAKAAERLKVLGPPTAPTPGAKPAPAKK
ncbi:MAG: tetratricopeptide repeat protein [Verrucomicrobiae bacterium]|nr:tetratricopeptide repeat protein [Verrucomicrobiae bacterium]